MIKYILSVRQQNNLEEYPSLAEGIGLENRQAGQTARGFESLFLLHYFYKNTRILRLYSLHIVTNFSFYNLI